jgi:hypothetical protein
MQALAEVKAAGGVAWGAGITVHYLYWLLQIVIICCWFSV